MRLHAALFALAVLVIGAGIAVSYPRATFSEVDTIADGVRDFSELEERFRTLANSKGGSYAFEVLKLAPLPPNTDLHLLGHAVGEELYEQKGPGGIALCTQDFRNACSHAIVIGTLDEFGANVTTLALIDDACKQAPGGSGAYTMCYHGLGHGVFAYFGYDLKHTVDFCERTGTDSYHNEQYTQCVGGAVMELMGGGGHDQELWQAARAHYLDDDPLAPCSSESISEEAKYFCYLYLTPRLFELAGADIGAPDPSTFPRAFSFCDAIPSAYQRQREACFGGFGKEFVPLAASRDIRSIDELDDDQYQLAISWCMVAPHDEARHACITEALASVFWGGENDPDASFLFCSLVPDRYAQESCYRDLGENIMRYIQGDRRAHLCGKFPEAYRATCAAEES